MTTWRLDLTKGRSKAGERARLKDLKVYKCEKEFCEECDEDSFIVYVGSEVLGQMDPFCLGCFLLDVASAYEPSDEMDKTFLSVVERALHFFEGE